MKRTVENIKDPLFRFFEREVNAGARLLLDVRRDISEVMQVCQGEKKPTNHHRTLLAELAKGLFPSSLRDWCRWIFFVRKRCCNSEEKPIPHSTTLVFARAGIIPQSWRRYTVPAGLTVIQWITDFSERIKQLQAVSQASQQGGPSALKVREQVVAVRQLSNAVPMHMIKLSYMTSNWKERALAATFALPVCAFSESERVAGRALHP